MRVKVTYGRTFNLGNYESERLDVEVECDHTRIGEGLQYAKLTVFNNSQDHKLEKLERDDLFALEKEVFE